MSIPRRLYISLLVHEKPEVILDQIRNFQRFAAGAVIVLHLSEGFSPPVEFFAALKKMANVHVNPVSVATNKVNLLCPHLENIKLIFGLDPDPEDFVAFHASNDLLVRDGLIQYIQDCTAGYFSDGVLDPERDVESAAMIAADTSFVQLLGKLGVKTIIWSQVEGCFFKIRHLRRAAAWIHEANLDMHLKRAYFAEEVILPTLVHKILQDEDHTRVVPCYVLSELSFLVKYVELRRRILGCTFFARILGRIFKILGPVRITPELVARIRRGNLGFYSFFGRSNGSFRFDAQTVFGVKRVERAIDDPLRKYIGILP